MELQQIGGLRGGAVTDIVDDLESLGVLLKQRDTALEFSSCIDLQVTAEFRVVRRNMDTYGVEKILY